MNKYNYIAKNTLVLFLGNFSSKVIVFIFLPLYTSVLTTSEYAICDLLNTTANLLSMLITICIAEGVMRFVMNDTYKSNEVLSIGLYISIFSILCVIIVCFWLEKSDALSPYTIYLPLFCLLYASYILEKLFLGFIKGKEKISLIAITSIISVITVIVFNLIFLLVFRIGIYGYLLAYIISHFITCFIYFVEGKIWREITGPVLNRELLKQMLVYCAPIMFTQICWWIDSSADRYIVALFSTTSAAGLIGVAHKVPAIMNTFTSIFMQAWNISAIKEFESNEFEAFFSRIFSLYNVFLFLCGGGIIVLAKPIGWLLFRGDFFVAWKLTPIYILAMIFSGVSSVLGAFSLASKKTSNLMTSTFIGSTTNIVLDILLLKIWGVFGVAIATALSYLLVAFIRWKQTESKYGIKIEYGYLIISYLVLVLLTIVVVYDFGSFSVILSIIFYLGLILINRNSVIMFISKLNEYLTERFLYKK